MDGGIIRTERITEKQLESLALDLGREFLTLLRDPKNKSPQRIIILDGSDYALIGSLMKKMGAYFEKEGEFVSVCIGEGEYRIDTDAFFNKY